MVSMSILPTSTVEVVIFGLRDFASLAHFYLDKDGPYQVVAFAVHGKYVDQVKFEGLPVIPFERVEEKYPPGAVRFFAPLSHTGMGRIREAVYNEIKAKGYDLISYVSSKATVFSPVGENCFVQENNTIQPYSEIGNNIIFWAGNHIGHHNVIKDHVMFTSHCVLSGHCVVEPYCYFGVNCTIRDGLHIAEGTFVAMSACVTKDTKPWSLYKGIPAKPGSDSSKELVF